MTLENIRLSGYLGFRWTVNILAIGKTFHFVHSDPYGVWETTKESELIAYGFY